MRTITKAAAQDSEVQSGESSYREYARPELGRLLKALGLDITYVRAEGDWMTYEADGVRHRVLDLVGGYGASLFGHHHPDLVAAAVKIFQQRVPIQAQASVRATAGDLAKELSRRIGCTTGKSYITTLTNSGTEAIEAALKHAELVRHELAEEQRRRWPRRCRALWRATGVDQSAFVQEVSQALGIPAVVSLPQAFEALAAANEQIQRERPVFLALEGAFHGKTSGALQLTHNTDLRTPFGGMGVSVVFLPASDPTAWARAIQEATHQTWNVARVGARLVLQRRPWVNVSAIVLEPIQGEGGIRVLERDDAAQIGKIAKECGVPIIIDEIQTGMGRTGTFLASTDCGIQGQYYTFAKSLGGGISKIGAVAIEREHYRPSFGLKHTSTFAEDDLSAVVAMESLKLLDREDVPARCHSLGEHLITGLQAVVVRFPDVLQEVRGRGLMLGLEFRAQDDNPSNAINMLSDQGYLGYTIAGYLLHEEGFRVVPTLSAPNTLRLEPSAFIHRADLDRFCVAITRACTAVRRGNAARLTRYLVGLAQLGDTSEVSDFRAHPRRTRREAPKCTKRVGFVSHLICAQDALLWDPSLASLNSAIERYQLAAHRILGPSRFDRVHVQSLTGDNVHLSVYGLNVTSKSISEAIRSRDQDWLVKLVEKAVSRALEEGCEVVGLGGYASILTDNGKRLRHPGVSITTGNSLTVGMGLRSVHRAAAHRELDLRSAHLGIVGATGNIGSVYARMMAPEVRQITLFGRNLGSRLSKVAWQIYVDALCSIESGEPPCGIAAAISQSRAIAEALVQRATGLKSPSAEDLGKAITHELGDNAPIQISEDIYDLQSCQVIVSASNSAVPIISAKHLGTGPTILCDISVPQDVAPSVRFERPDTVVLQGGLVSIPNDPAFQISGVPLPPGVSFACMAETLLLGLEGIQTPYSLGEVEPVKVRQILQWAEMHGFTLGEDKAHVSPPNS